MPAPHCVPFHASARLRSLLCAALLGCTAACGGSEPGDALPAGTGAAAARVVVSASGGGSVYTEVRVRVGVYEGAGIGCDSFLPAPPRPPLVQAVFAVAAGGGRIQGIPAGVNRIFFAEGLNSGGETVSRGCVAGVIIIPGANTVLPEPIRLAPAYPAPEIEAVAPPYAFPGEEVRIRGRNFSPVPGENQVLFAGDPGDLLGASSSELRARVPPDACSGKLTVRVGRLDSAGSDFTVIEAEIPYTRPYAFGITPDGKRIYVTRQTVGPAEPGVVSVLDIDPATPTYNRIVAPEIARSSLYTVDRIAVSPDGTLAYGPAAYETLVIDTDPASPTYNTLIASFGFPYGGPLYNPVDAVLTPDSRRAYVAYMETGDVGVFDAQRRGGRFNDLLARISFGDDPSRTWPQHMAIAPDGRRVFVSLENERRVAAVNSDPLSTGYHEVTGRYDMGLKPRGVAVTHDGLWLCAADTLADTVVVAVADGDAGHGPAGSTAGTIRTVRNPSWVVPSPCDRFLYAAGGDDRLAVVNRQHEDPSQWFCQSLLPLPEQDVRCIAVTQDQSRAYLGFPSGTILAVRLARPGPVLAGLDPLTGDEGSLLSIAGRGFSPLAEENLVVFRGAQTPAEQAGPGGLTVRVPRDARPGPVYVVAGGTRSNGIHFSVTPLDAGRFPVAEYLYRVDASPDGRYLFATQTPNPAYDALGTLIDADPASPTFQSVLWQEIIDPIVSYTCRFSPDSTKVYLNLDSFLAVAYLGKEHPSKPRIRRLGGLRMTDIAFDAAAGRAYFCEHYENRLYRLNLATDETVGDPLTIGAPPEEQLHAVVVDPSSGEDLYVLSRNMRGNDRVYRVSRTSWEVVSGAEAGMNCLAMAISPDGKVLYVADQAEGTVLVMDTAVMKGAGDRDAVAAVIPVGVKPERLCLAPDRERLYVVNTGSSELSIIDTDPASPTRLQNIQSFPTLPGPVDMTITPDGSRAYVLNWLDRDGRIQVVLLHDIP